MCYILSLLIGYAHTKKRFIHSLKNKVGIYTYICYNILLPFYFSSVFPSWDNNFIVIAHRLNLDVILSRFRPSFKWIKYGFFCCPIQQSFAINASWGRGIHIRGGHRRHFSRFQKTCFKHLLLSSAHSMYTYTHTHCIT